MNNYIILCTEEQTRKAYELGAPLNFDYHADDFQNAIKIANKLYAEVPTAEEMLGWLEDQLFMYINISYYVTGDYWCYHGVTNGGHDSICYNMTSYNSRKEATIAAIDAALDYLINNKK